MPEETTSKNRMTEERWFALFNEWQLSGESQEKFCNLKGINYHTFVYWRTKQNAKQKSQTNTSFAKVRVSGSIATSTNSFRIILTNGAQIIIPPDYDKRTLSDFLKIVCVIPC